MSYLSAEDPKITEDINTRKEFSSYKIDKQSYRKYDDNIIPRFMLDDYLQKGRYLQLHSYQLFVRNFMNPNTPYSRLLLKWETGIGKTVGSLSIAFNFINYYRKEQRESLEEVGTVFVIGFSERVFKNELLRFPELGFISREEYKKMHKLKKLASSGSAYELDKLREFVIRIRKRFSNRKGYGFFKFIGYKAFVNRIFKIIDEGINFNSLSELEIYKHIEAGDIEVNQELLQKFRNSLIICDEIHNTYNSLDKNNWGVAIQYVLDNSETTRAIFMSATPLNNSPTEIIDLLNLLLPKDNKLEKENFFTLERELKPGALEKIARHCQGRVSFLRDVNPKYFPRRKMIGEQLPGVKYLKFIRCPMSEFHYNTYKQVYKGALPQDSQYLIDFALPNPEAGSTIGLYQTQVIKRSLNYASQKWKDLNKISFFEDRIIGNFLKKKNIGEFSTKYFKMIENLHEIIKKDSGKIFIYHNVVHISGVLFIQELLLENGFLDEFGNSHDNTLCVICGNPRRNHSKAQLSAMLGGKETIILGNLRIAESSSKGIVHEAEQEVPMVTYFFRKNAIVIDAGQMNYLPEKDFLFEELFDYLNSQGKSVIVQTLKVQSGLHSILEKHGYTRSAWKHYEVFRKESSGEKPAAKKSGEEEETSQHHYRPARFIAVHSEIEKNQLYQSLEKYNHPENSFGHNYLILVGSKIVRESHDFKSIRNIFIMGRPDNVPMLKQIIGRAIRKNSHINLPVKQRTVDIRIFTTCLPTKTKGVYDLSYEEIKYSEKVHFYQIIQNIEKVFHENAIDSIINKDTIKIHIDDPFQSNPAEMIKHYNMLPYKPNVPSKFLTKTFKLNELNLSTFDIFHYKSEIKTMTSIIKRLFVELSPVWAYDDLLKMTKHPPFITEVNTSIFGEDLFGISLSRLLWNRDVRYSEPYFESFEGNFMEKILNPEDKYIIIPGGEKSVIVHVGKYYILFPLDETDNPIMDIEYSYRITHKQNKRKINLQGFMENISTLFNYEEKRDKFYIKWKNVSISNMEPAIVDFGLSFHILFVEECIEYVFNLWINGAKKSKMHDFYITMIYYYDARRLIIWASTAREFIANLYKDYIIPVSLKVLLKQSKDLGIEDLDDKQLSTEGIVNMLKSSINNSRESWVPSEIQAHYQASKNRFDEFYKAIQKKKMNAPADILPIGHIITNVPKFYHSDRGGWFESPEYVNTRTDYKENALIIGYDEKIKNSVHIRFKIRPPVQNIKKSKDSRKIERGSVCNSSKSKVFLKDVSKKLGINIEPKMNVNKLCDRIRRRLIYNELKERLDPKSKNKWFYFSYERQPIF